QAVHRVTRSSWSGCILEDHGPHRRHIQVEAAVDEVWTQAVVAKARDQVARRARQRIGLNQSCADGLCRQPCLDNRKPGALAEVPLDALAKAMKDGVFEAVAG